MKDNIHRHKAEKMLDKFLYKDDKVKLLLFYIYL